MFKGKDLLKTECSVLTEHCKVTGQIEFKGSLVVECELIGDITRGEKLEIAPKGRMEGNARVVEAEIGGYYKGTMRVEKKLILHKSAIVEGEIQMESNALETEPGARIEGAIHMPKKEGGAPPSPLKPEAVKAKA